MASTDTFATYIIVLSDQALVSQYQAQFPNGLQINPAAAAAQYTPAFNTSFWTTGGNKPSSPRVDLYFNNPATLPFNVDSVTIPASRTESVNGDIWVWPGVPAHQLKWIGYFLMEPALSSFVPTGPLAPRRWACGFELPTQGEGNSGSGLTHFSRDASRTPKGLGFAYRSDLNDQITFSTTVVNPVANPGAPTAVFTGATSIVPPTATYTVTYKIVAFNAGGSSFAGPAGTATFLNNYDTFSIGVTWAAVPTATFYGVWRTGFSGPALSTGFIGLVADPSFSDTGQAGDSSLPPSVTHISPGISWERFYIRVRTLPTGGEDEFWYINGSVEAGSSVIATLAPNGAINFYNKGNAAYPGTLMGTIAAKDVPLNTWVRFDIVIAYKNATPNFQFGGTFSVSLIPQSGGYGSGFGSQLGNGFGPVNINTGGGLNTTQKHISSSIGSEGFPGVSFGSEIDFDDWINMDPALTTFTSRDWMYGSHVILANASGFDPNSSGWVGDYRILEGNPVLGQFGNDFLQSSTPSAPIVVTTDFEDTQLGCVALTVAAYAFAAGGVTSQLGYGAKGGSIISSPVTATTGSWMKKINSFPDGIITDPLKLNPLVLQYTKDTGVSIQKIQALAATAEFLGDWGPEDFPSIEWPPIRGIHNAPYWNSTSVHSFAPPLGAVAIMSGTYVGNGTGQDIATQVPLHWWWCRPLTSNTGGSHWWSSMIAGHDHDSQLPKVNRLVQARQLPEVNGTPGPCQVQISGADPQINANGVTYQWIGFSDPGQRYVLNGVCSHINTLAAATNLLADPGFTPQAAFFCKETTSGTDGMMYKGPGMTLENVMSLAGTSIATAAILGAGVITTKAAINSSIPQLSYSLWRTNDGLNGGTPVAITSYIGDGTGSRNIALALGGFSPLFALVQPGNGKAYFRDPSHTGTQSEAIDQNNPVTTAITAGTANQITVDTTLNANLIVYDVFALGSNQTSGWGTNPSTASGDANNPILPIIGAGTVMSPSQAWAPVDTRGWWASTLGFRGAADLITTPQNPKHPRGWDKLAAFSTGNAAMLGGSPGGAITFDNDLYYPGDDYSLGTTSPTIRVFDGLSDRLVTSIPNAAGTVPKAIMSMFVNAGTIYLTTLDSGTNSSNWAGRVFTLDPLSQNLAQLGTSSFSGGEVPYALIWHMGRLWLGTNKGDGSAGKIYFIRPGIDADWTLDRNLSTDSVGGVDSFGSFQGKLYIGTDGGAGTFAKVIVRDSLGAYTTSLTATGGTARVNNGFLSMSVFINNLYVTYWNPDTPVPGSSIALIKKFDGTTWTTAYTGAGTTNRPYIASFVSNGYIFVIGGGDNLSASLVGSVDGATWDNLTPFLSGPTTETALPIFGGVGN